MADAGLWETFTSYFLNRSISSLVSQTVWTASRFLSSTPSLWRCVTVGSPYTAWVYSISDLASATCICTPTPYLSASSFVFTIRASVLLNMVRRPNHTCTLPSAVLWYLFRSSICWSSSSSMVLCQISGSPSPQSITDFASFARSPASVTAFAIPLTNCPPGSAKLVTPARICSRQHISVDT